MKDKRRATGMKNELYVQKYLEGDGYVVHRARASLIKTKTSVFCRSNDILECIDILGKRKDRKILWIQVSTGSRKSEKEKKILSQDVWNPKTDEVEIWLCFKGNLWKIYKLDFKENKFVEYKKIERGKTFTIDT